MDNDYKKKIELWEAKNPLTIWRKEQGLSRNAVAVLVNSSLNSVINWERGGSIPTDEKLSLIARVMGTDLQTLRGEWREWTRLLRGKQA